MSVKENNQVVLIIICSYIIKMNKLNEYQKVPEHIPNIINSKYKGGDYYDLIKLVNSKKNQYQRELSKDDINLNDRPLNYARSQSSANPLQEMSAQSKEAFRDQMLARGVTIAQFSQEKLSQNKKPKLLKIDLTPQNIVHGEPRSLDKFKTKSEPRKMRFKSEAAKNIKQRKMSEYFRVLTEQRSNCQQSPLIKTFIEGITELKRGGKNNARLERVAKDLESFNPFFRKLQRVITVCLLRIGNIIQKSRKSVIYGIGSPYSCFYIILTGTVKLKGYDHMHKICQLGESIHQELLLNKNGETYSLQKAKTINQSYLLQIQKSAYLRLQSQLTRFGFRQGVNELESLLKRNTIVKNWLRNKFRLMNNN